MELVLVDILSCVSAWMEPRDNTKYLGRLSKSLNTALSKHTGTQHYWKQLVLNMTVNSSDLLNKDTDCWENVYDARRRYPDYFRDLDKCTKEQVVKKLYWAANGTKLERVSLVLLDPRLTQEDILATLSSPYAPMRRAADAYVKRVHLNAWMLSLLVSDRRVDTYQWFESVIQSESIGWEVLDFMLDEDNVRSRLTELQVVELDEQITELRYKHEE